MPRDLPPAARVEWRALVRVLSDYHTISPLDRWALGDMSLCAARLAEAEKLIGSSGLLIKSHGRLAKNPLITIAARYRDQLRAWALHFGLTPAARARLNIANEPPDTVLDPFEQYLLNKESPDADDPQTA